MPLAKGLEGALRRPQNARDQVNKLRETNTAELENLGKPVNQIEYLESEMARLERRNTELERELLECYRIIHSQRFGIQG